MDKVIIGVVVLVVLGVAAFWLLRRRRRGIAGAGLICVTPQEFTLSSPAVKSAAERALAGEPKFHPIMTSQDESGSVLIQAGEHPIHVGRTIAEDDEDQYGLALFYAAGAGQLDPNEAYIMLGKLAFELMPAGATRLIAPHFGREAGLTDEMKTAMKEGDFFFGGSFYGEPWLVQVDGDSAEMKAAVEQARTRWPEFVEAFRNRASGEDAQYAVKMPLEFAGQVEFIWIEVQNITDESITGNLANDSMHDRKVKAGHTVTAPLKDLNDWMILKDEEMTGGFTVPILMRQA